MTDSIRPKAPPTLGCRLHDQIVHNTTARAVAKLHDRLAAQFVVSRVSTDWVQIDIAAARMCAATLEIYQTLPVDRRDALCRDAAVFGARTDAPDVAFMREMPTMNEPTRDSVNEYAYTCWAGLISLWGDDDETSATGKAPFASLVARRCLSD